MAVPEDYVGARFGSFAITSHLGAGAEAEVFICEHVPSRNRYVLRLDIEADALWDDEPLIPPVNGDFERKGVQIVWSLGNDDKPRWPEGVAMHYRVVGQEHVVPLCSPWRLTHALTAVQVQNLREAVMPELDSFSLYSDVAIGMAAEAAYSGMTESAFLDRWGELSGGSHLLAMITPDLGNLVEEAEARRVSDLLARRRGTAPELAENRLLWLCVAALHDLLSLDAWSETLMCRWFRESIAAHEVEQFLAMERVLAQGIDNYVTETLDHSNKWVAEVLRRLAAEPLSPSVSPEFFVKAESEPPVVGSDWLVLQDYAARSGALIR